MSQIADFPDWLIHHLFVSFLAEKNLSKKKYEENPIISLFYHSEQFNTVSVIITLTNFLLKFIQSISEQACLT
jgi:hypothetical protein